MCRCGGPGCPGPSLPLMEFAAPRSLVCSRLAGPSGSLLPPRLDVSVGPAVSHRLPSAAGFHPQLHPPTSFSPPSECCDPRPAHRLSRNLATTRKASERLPWGSVPHRDINRRRPTRRPEDPTPRAWFRPRRFARPRRLAPPHRLPPCGFHRLDHPQPCGPWMISGLAGLFHPAATSRVRPSGVCASRRSRTRFPWPLPSCRSKRPPAV